MVASAGAGGAKRSSGRLESRSTGSWAGPHGPTVVLPAWRLPRNSHPQVPFSDVAVSGSCDGALRFWHCNEAARSLRQVLSAPVKGFVNGLVVAPSGRFVVAAVGQEHRLGRWFRVREAKNGCAVISLPAELHRKS